MTKQEALENHRKLWNWIADKTMERKRRVEKFEYFEENGIDMILNGCYCCKYDSQFNNLCDHCPIDWGNDNNDCCYKNSPYNKWSFEYDYLKAAQYAREIANLPEREGV